MMSFKKVIEKLTIETADIMFLLRDEKIPFTFVGFGSFLDEHLPSGRELICITTQLRFPWCEGDVVVGTLHSHDDEIIEERAPNDRFSIESYNFPWDEGDITVFDTPEEFVEKLKAYYKEVMGK